MNKRYIKENKPSQSNQTWKKENKVRIRTKQRIEVVVMAGVFLDNRTIERRVLEHTTRGQGRKNDQRRTEDARELKAEGHESEQLAPGLLEGGEKGEGEV